MSKNMDGTIYKFWEELSEESQDILRKYSTSLEGFKDWIIQQTNGPYTPEFKQIVTFLASVGYWTWREYLDETEGVPWKE